MTITPKQRAFLHTLIEAGGRVAQSGLTPWQAGLGTGLALRRMTIWEYGTGARRLDREAIRITPLGRAALEDGR